MPQDCLEQSRLTAMEGGNAARLPGAIAAATSLWFSNAGAIADDCMDAGGRAPTVGALGDAGAIAENTESFID